MPKQVKRTYTKSPNFEAANIIRKLRKNPDVSHTVENYLLADRDGVINGIKQQVYNAGFEAGRREVPAHAKQTFIIAFEKICESNARIAEAHAHLIQYGKELLGAWLHTTRLT